MYTFLLVDPNIKNRKRLAKHIREVEVNCNILEASTTDEALRCFITQKPNLIFLDAELPDKGGFEFIRELHQVGEQVRVVLLAEHQKYAVEAIKASVMDYLMKPYEGKEVRNCLKRLKAMEDEEMEKEDLSELMMRLKMNHRLRVNSKGGFEILKSEEILYCEANSNYTDIFLVDGRMRTTSTTLKIVENQLSRELFFRINRSILINLNFLVEVNRKERYCILENGRERIELPLSQKRIPVLNEIF